MKTYKVIYTEEISYEFPVEADSQEGAIQEFIRMADNQELLFEHGNVEATNISIGD